MFGRTLMTLGLAMLLAAPAHAGFGLVLPDSPIVDDPEKTSLNLVICADVYKRQGPAQGQKAG